MIVAYYIHNLISTQFTTLICTERWVHDSVVQDHPDLSKFEIYMSGPPPMIDAGRAAFLAHALDQERLYSDSFEYGAAADKT